MVSKIVSKGKERGKKDKRYCGNTTNLSNAISECYNCDGRNIQKMMRQKGRLKKGQTKKKMSSLRIDSRLCGKKGS
jgi:hypothetical protein